MAHQHGVVACGVQPSVDGVVQRRPSQRAPALQQQVLIEHEVAFICGLQICGPSRRRAGPRG